MKKFIVMVSATMVIASNLFAQDPMFEKGDKVVNVGVGLLSAL